ncbi:concanavalin A-like lectin/glucanase [Lojkania enalia]|uniref:Concanavalin A-like lectin/glucanase n=1 Tax=Lojkania enalia TaxID=147567 RepID=A0A9P4K6S6_9PLEO|nr:concanavalin A-like lectin/glucanase [Didymosphaeria enalia]
MRSSTFLGGICLLPAVFAAFDLNRGGAVLKAPAGDSFQSVTGTFTVPSLSGNSKLAIWIGIGDTANQDYVLRGGVKYDTNLKSFAGWLKGGYFPLNDTDTTSTVPVRASDSFVITVAVTSKTTGTVTIENRTQNRRTTQTITAPDSWDPEMLTSLAADWFVQGYQDAGELITTPRYGTVSFTAVGATLASGRTVGATGAGRYEIQGTSGQIYSQTTITSNGVSVRQM